jgi:hypothetical protein
MLASSFTALIARNPVHEDSRTAVAGLLRTALAAFAQSPRADIVFFKSLYCFARDEGYPVKQQWFPSLASAEQTLAVELLNRPLAAQTAAPESTTHLTRLLETYLRNDTEILFD